MSVNQYVIVCPILPDAYRGIESLDLPRGHDVGANRQIVDADRPRRHDLGRWSQ